MRKHLIPVLVALAAAPLGACSSSNYGGGGSGYGGTVDTQYATNAHFLPGDPTVIEVTVRDPLPAARVFLIDPSGQQTAAHDLQRDRRVYQSNSGPKPSVGVGVGGGSSGGVSTGIGIGFPIFSSGGASQTSSVIDSTAKVRISNPTLYRTTWQKWKLRVELDDGVNKRVIETLPPKPL